MLRLRRKIQRDPLLALLTQGHTFSLRTALGVTFIPAVVAPAVMLIPGLYTVQLKAPLYFTGLLFCAWLVFVTIPPALAAISTLLTANVLKSELFDLLRLSHLAQPRINRALTFSMFYRLHILSALLLGMTPVLLAGMSRRTLIWSLGPYGLSPFTLSKSIVGLTPMRLVVWRLDRLGWAPEFYGWVVGAWGALLLAVTLGVTCARHIKQPGLAATFAALIVLAGSLSLLVIPLLPLEDLAFFARVLLALAIALTPFITSLLLIYLPVERS